MTGTTMEINFCSGCGTLMHRISSGFPDKRIPRIGTVDDFDLHETKLKPRLEQFVKDRVSWFTGGQGVKQENGNDDTGQRGSMAVETSFLMVGQALKYGYQMWSVATRSA